MVEAFAFALVGVWGAALVALVVYVGAHAVVRASYALKARAGRGRVIAQAENVVRLGR